MVKLQGISPKYIIHEVSSPYKNCNSAFIHGVEHWTNGEKTLKWRIYLSEENTTGGVGDF